MKTKTVTITLTAQKLIEGYIERTVEVPEETGQEEWKALAQHIQENAEEEEYMWEDAAELDFNPLDDIIVQPANDKDKASERWVLDEDGEWSLEAFGPEMNPDWSPGDMD